MFRTLDQIKENVEITKEPTEQAGGFRSLSTILGEKQEKAPFDLGKALRNIPKSGIQMGKDIFGALTKPVETIKGIGTLARGAFEKLTPGVQEEEASFDALIGFYKDRYGSIDKLKRTVEDDPVGFAADLADVLTLGGTAVSKLGGATKVARLADIGSDIAKIGRFIDPVTLPSKMIGSLADHFAGKKVAPFASQIDEKTVAVAKKYGIDLTASMSSESEVVRRIEMLGVNDIQKKKLTDAVSKMNSLAQDITDKIDNSVDAAEAGELMAREAANFRDEFTVIKNSLYESVSDVKKNPWVNIEDYKKIIDDIVKEKKLAKVPAEDLAFFEKSQASIATRKSIRFNEAVSTLNEINNKTGWGQSKILGTAAETLKNTINKVAEGTPYAKAISEADAFYGGGREVMKTSWFKKMVKSSAKPEDLYKVIKPQQPTIANQVMEFLSPEAQNNVKKLITNDIIADLSSPATGKLKQNAVSRVLTKWGGETLGEVFRGTEPLEFLTQIQDKMKDIDILKDAIKKGENIVKVGEQVGAAKIVGQVAGAFSGNIMAAIGAMIGDSLLLKLINSESGQRFLTTGLNVPQIELNKFIDIQRGVVEPARIAEVLSNE